MAIYEGRNGKSEGATPKKNGDKDDAMHVPKKRKSEAAEAEMDTATFQAIPKKKKSRA